MWVKVGNPYPLTKAVKVKRLPTHLELAYSQRPCKTARLGHPRPLSFSTLPSLSSSAQVLASPVRESTPIMSGSGAGGKWMASSVKKEGIKKLREAGYLAKNVTR